MREKKKYTFRLAQFLRTETPLLKNDAKILQMKILLHLCI